MCQHAYRYSLRLLMALYLSTLKAVARVAPCKRTVPEEGYDILLTGTFYSANWLLPHLQPLAGASCCRRVRMVAISPVPAAPKLEAIYPPSWLQKLIGGVPARLLVFAWIAIKDRPHVVGGFHLLLNGLIAILLARLVGARSLYICGGGEREVLGGGYLTENRIFRRIGRTDSIIERQLLAAVQHCDMIIVMGSGAKKFFAQRGIAGSIHIMPGGFDEIRFQPSHALPTKEIITVGRLSTVKRIDLLLEVVALLQSAHPAISAIVVGDGPERTALERKAMELGIGDRIKFVGHQDNVENWLQQSKIFVLCSDSEGVSQAMMQAMLCGLPAVVSHVGDLADVVVNGKNGFLISDRIPQEFALQIEALLQDSQKKNSMCLAARKTAEQYGIAATSLKWDDVLKENEYPRISASQ